MFEKYTETARRVIFFGRYEASQVGSAYIEPEHLLLGVLREDKVLLNRFLRSRAALESLRREIEGRLTVRASTSTSPDLPLSESGKRVLAFAAEEAERLVHKHIGTEHLLLGLLREEKSIAAVILRGRGLRLTSIREELGRTPSEESAKGRPASGSVLSELGRDLTQSVLDGQLGVPVNRDHEIKCVIQTLCRCTNNNPVLIGEIDASTISVVEGLARRIADGNVPSFLEDKKIVALDISRLEAYSGGGAPFKERIKALINELNEVHNVLLFIEEFSSLCATVSGDGWLDVAGLLSPPLLAGNMRCIAATTPSGYSSVIRKHGELAACFQQVRVTPLDDTECISVLVSLKDRFEHFHRVTFEADVITAVMAYAKREASERSLLVKAVDLLDAVGAHTQVRRENLPEEVREVQKRIRFIVHRMETSIANHEFEKARFYSDEERKERESLRRLKEQHHIDETMSVVTITEMDVAEVAGLGLGAA